MHAVLTVPAFHCVQHTELVISASELYSYLRTDTWGLLQSTYQWPHLGSDMVGLFASMSLNGQEKWSIQGKFPKEFLPCKLMQMWWTLIPQNRVQTIRAHWLQLIPQGNAYLPRHISPGHWILKNLCHYSTLAVSCQWTCNTLLSWS